MDIASWFNTFHNVELDFTQIETLTEFLTGVSNTVEEWLQQNETVDIFKAEFADLGDDDLGFATANNSSWTMREVRNFHDVTYTKDKRIESVRWVPDSTQLLWVSCFDKTPFNDRVDDMVRWSISHILLWSFTDSLAPHASLLSPYDVSILEFCPSDRHYMIGGLSSGQMCVWKLSPADLGPTKNIKKGWDDDDKDMAGQIPTIQHKCLSFIDDSHKKPVLAISWLPPNIIIEKKGKTRGNGYPVDGPNRYFVTTVSLFVWRKIKWLLDSSTIHILNKFTW